MRIESGADKLFGRRPLVSDEVIDDISHPDQIEDDTPFPVRVLPYLDEKTHTMKNQLDARGYRIDRKLSDQSGIQRISVNRFRKLSRGSKPEVDIENNSEIAMNVSVVSHPLPDGKAVIRTDLLPNEHGIKGNGSRHYLVDENELQPVYREPHPAVKKVGNVNFGLLIKNAVVDLINK